MPGTKFGDNQSQKAQILKNGKRLNFLQKSVKKIVFKDIINKIFQILFRIFQNRPEFKYTIFIYIQKWPNHYFISGKQFQKGQMATLLHKKVARKMLMEMPTDLQKLIQPELPKG